MAINFLNITETLVEARINDNTVGVALPTPRLAFKENGLVSGGVSTTAGNLVLETSNGTERLRILGATGGIKLANYGTSGFTGTAAFNLEVDSSGNIIQTQAGGGGSGTITGSGTATRVAFWSGTTALSSDSNLYWDNPNNRLGVGTSNPTASLHVAGNALLQNFYQTIANTSGVANKGGYIARPKGGDFISQSSSQTGSLEIQLPTGGNTMDDMVKFVIDIYEYSTNRSLTVFVGGYVYQGIGGTTWLNCSAQVIGSTAADNYTVRFGDNDNVHCVWIGETTETWSYPQVIVRDFYGGFITDVTEYLADWDIDFVEEQSNVAITLTNNFPLSSGGASGAFLPLSGGTMTGTGEIRMPDSFKLKAGTSGDLEIYHNSTDTFIDNQTGNLIIQNSLNDADIIFKAFNTAGALDTYFDIDGSAGVTKFRIDTRHLDNVKATFGASNDLKIYHNGSNSFIQDTGSGVLAIDTNGSDVRITKTDTEFMAKFITDGAVELYHDNSKKFETTSTGVSVTGKVSGVTAGTANTDAVNVQQLNQATTGVLVYKGTWEADSNDPNLESGVGTPGEYYIVSVAGTTDLDGIDEWGVGDWAVFSDQATDAWQKIDNTNILAGTGTGGTISAWTGTGTSTTLGNSPLTFSGTALTSSGSATFAGNVSLSSGSLNVIGASSVNTTGRFESGAGSTISYLQLLPNGATDTNSGYIGYDTSNRLKFYTQNTLALTLDNSQNATFAGNVTTNGDIIIDNSSGDPFLKLKTTAQEYVIRIDQSDSEKFQIRNVTSGVNSLIIDTSSNATFAANISAGATTDTVDRSIKVLSGDTKQASLEAYGAAQGTGVVYVGQSASYGGGIVYNGDGSPAFGNVSTDTISFYRREGGTNYQVFRYGYGSSTVIFTGNINFGDSHFIGDDADDNLLIQSSTNENVIINSADDLYFRTSGTTQLTITGTTSTFSGNVDLGNNNITDINVLSFDDGISLFGGGDDSYLHYKSSDVGAGGIEFFDGNDAKQGYLYYDGDNTTPSFGLLDATGTWAVRIVKDGLVELRHDNAIKFQTTSTGVSVTGKIVADGLNYNGTSGGELRIDNSLGGGIGYYADQSGHTFNTWVGSWVPQLVIADSGTATFAGNLIVADSIGINTSSPDTKLDVVGGILRNSTRVSALDNRKYPLGHYNSSSNIFDIDPTWSQDELRAFFNSTGVAWVADADAPGGYAIEVTGSVAVGGQYTSGFPYIPIDTSGSYYMECYVKNVTAGNAHYMGGIDFNESFGSLGGNPGSFGYWVMINTNPGTSWTKVSGTISGFGNSIGQFKAGTKYMTPMSLFNYSGTVAAANRVSRISGWRMIRTDSPGSGFLPLSGGTMTLSSSPLILPGEESNAFKIAFTGASASSGLSTVDQSGAGLYIGANSRVNTSGVVVTNNTLLPGSGIYFDGWSNDDMRFFTGATGNPSLKMIIESGGNVGIGVTGPNAPLDVASKTQNSSGIQQWSYNSAPTLYRLQLNQIVSSGLVKFSFDQLNAGSAYNNVLVLDTGKVGIGIAGPNAKLHVDAPSTTANSLTFGAAAGQIFTNENSEFAFGLSNASPYPLYIQGRTSTNTARNITLQVLGGNIGIGTTNPASKLVVSDVGQANGTQNITARIVNVVAGATSSAVYIGASAGTDWLIGKNIYGVSTQTYFQIGNQSGTTPAMTIATNNNVGIGTTSPYSQLQVGDTEQTSSAILTIASRYGASAPFLNFRSGHASNTNVWDMAHILVSDDGNYNGNIQFQTTTTGGNTTGVPNTKMIIKATGKVGIGNTVPLANLDISNTAGGVYQQWSYDNPGANNYNLQLTETVTSGNVRFVFDQKNGGTQYSDVLVFNQGKIGIGTDEPTEKLTVSGNIHLAANQSYISFNTSASSGHPKIRMESDGDFSFLNTAGASSMIIENGGKVGIGTTAPGATLDLGLPTGVAGTAGSVDRLHIAPFSNTGGPYKFIARTVSGSSDFLDMYYGSNHIISYSLNGNVGINQTSPSAKLDIQPTASNGKVIKIANDVMSTYNYTSQVDAVLAWTCGSYHQAEVVITANQTNGGTTNNLYIRGIWSNNHTSHHWDELEHIGSLTGSTFTMSVGQNGSTTASGRLELDFNYVSGSFSQLNVRVTDFFGTHAYTIT